ncbi:MAG: 3-isopropylmalate dehydratase large subunit [Candidatus Aminicenantaceae bacterium]
MGKTIIEKIIQNHTQEEVKPGKVVWMDLDIRSARDFGGPNVVRNYRREYGDAPVADLKKTFFTFDLCVPACSLKYADNQQICREYAQSQGMQIYDIDQGIGSHILMEKGLAKAGSTVVGTDSHMNILGAVGCFGQGMGDMDVTFAFRTGKTWFEIPETLRVIIKGELPKTASAKDLTLYILKKLGTKKAALKAIEFYGDAVRKLFLSERITLCSMVTEMAGIIGFVPECDRSFRKEMEKFSGVSYNPLNSDEDCIYSDTVEININDIEPQIAAPFSPDNVMKISELRNVKIHTGFIGSCTNGRTDDIACAAHILKGNRIKKGVTLKVVPATRTVYRELLENGILEDLFKSGAIIRNPGCSGCANGHIGLTGKDEIQISTGNRNFEGKQGKGKTYLASPAVVAASCITGQITSPEDL